MGDKEKTVESFNFITTSVLLEAMFIDNTQDGIEWVRAVLWWKTF